MSQHNQKEEHLHDDEKIQSDNGEVALESEEIVAETIEEDYEALQEKCNELNDKNLRLMAEFDNYRKRTLKERIELIKTANEKILVDILPLVDDFERAMDAMKSTDNADAVKEGIELIYSKFIKFLEQNGVKEIPTKDETFNPEHHEAVTLFPAPSEDMKGKIVDTLSKGYTLDDKVIRFPKVVVGE